ncbi:MAG: hypothetical protein ACRDOI_46595 [Trebonia sp.]
MSERNSRDSRRRALEEARQAEQRRKRRLRLAAWGGAVVVVAGTGLGLGLGLSGSGAGPEASSGSGSAASYGSLSSLGPLTAAPAPGSLGPENVPIPSVPALAGTSAATAGQAIDGISCNTSEQTVFHIHTHLTIFVNGQQRQVPAGIGIPDAVAQPTQAGAFVESGSCFYWLHTHAADGVIHIESPVQRTYTLGEFFDELGQPLGPSQAGPARGQVTVIVNGQVFKGNPRDVPLGSHENLQVEVGTPLVTPETINWSSTGL